MGETIPFNSPILSTLKGRILYREVHLGGWSFEGRLEFCPLLVSSSPDSVSGT